ncbi:MAG: YlbF family regulator [Clostridia bacterium]
MDIITLAREMGKELQKDDAYKAYQVAKENSDKDVELQNLIGEFNLKRMAINNEAQKSERDDDLIQKLNTELREVYNTIMENENMNAYNVAKTEIDALVQRATAIIGMCAEGEDPETADVDLSSCGGDCGSCGGCH